MMIYGNVLVLDIKKYIFAQTSNIVPQGLFCTKDARLLMENASKVYMFTLIHKKGKTPSLFLPWRLSQFVPHLLPPPCSPSQPEKKSTKTG